MNSSVVVVIHIYTEAGEGEPTESQAGSFDVYICIIVSERADSAIYPC
jgi:hypothetical protein